MADVKNTTRQGKVLFPIILGGLAVVAICALAMFYVKKTNVEQVGVNKAKALADQIVILRKFYSSEVVSRAKKGKLRVNYDWDQDETTLPLPATFTNVVGKKIEKENPGTSIRLYSRYPFPYRKATEKYDEFEMEALQELEQGQTKSFYRFENWDGKLSVRYAIPDVMGESCVSCHNAHPESPKTDWKVGDVRGVVEVITPVQGIEDGLQVGTWILLFLVTSGIGIVVAISHFSIKKPIRETVEVMSATSSQMAAAVEEQERTAILQSASVNQTTTTMEELSVSSLRGAEQSEAAATGAQKASSLAEEGAQMVQNAMTQIISTKEKVEAIADQIHRLSQQTNQIGNITNLVSNIANQTNLLALNAAVEAARAGEHGRGFAVVAAEIRKLADQSKAAAEKIQAILEDIQQNTNSTVSVTDDGTKTAEDAAQEAQSAVKTFLGVKAALDSALQSAKQIALNVKEQAAAIKQVEDAMSTLNAGGKEIAAGVRETRVGIQALDGAVQRLKSM